MDRLWSPWRYQYISAADPSSDCVFCVKAAEGRDAENYIVFRGKSNYILLNLFPYTTGHLMIAPYQHISNLEDAPEPVLVEMMQLTRDAVRQLKAVYRAEGINLGMNLGRSAGAGIAGHIHMHVLPRWTGDANFMTTIGETRVLPEDLLTTHRKLSQAFRGVALNG